MDRHFASPAPSLPLLPLLLLHTLAGVAPALSPRRPPPTEPPLIDGFPYVVVWNAPTEKCQDLRVPLEVSAAFQAVTTPAAVPGQLLTLFYEDRLGLYPKVGADGRRRWNGVIPQRVNVTRHLAKARQDIAHYIPRNVTPGLAVIDWEAWRPLWDQNWGSQDIYRKLSVVEAMKNVAPACRDPWQSVATAAKRRFQKAGRRLMEATIGLGIAERPAQRWGFYLFPDCYNRSWRRRGYTGECPPEARRSNDRLLWLWEASTALYPSVYLHPDIRNRASAALYVRNRVQEAVRVAALSGRPSTVPIYVYSRPLYRNQNRIYLTQKDLVSTIGEAAALGASGTVLWGASADYNDKASCLALSAYLRSTLNPYVANVTAAARLCSTLLCQGAGRCVRKSYDSGAYLHLNAGRFQVLRADGRYLAVGAPTAADLRALEESFTCQCYAGRMCAPKLERPEKIMVIWV